MLPYRRLDVINSQNPEHSKLAIAPSKGYIYTFELSATPHF